MIRLSELKLPLDHTTADLHALVVNTMGLPASAVAEVRPFKRSYDARKADLRVVYIVDVVLAPEAAEAEVLARLKGRPHIAPSPDTSYRLPTVGPAALAQPRPVVVGFGPCGMFAALILAQAGLRPIVLERGKTVRERTKDTWGLWRKRVLQPESNVQFGEGGAGTFSDGKLYSQIKDPRHLGRKVMEEFVKAGAPPDILLESHPHIGTFRLVKVVEGLRTQIEALGGEIRFQHRVVDLEHSSDATGQARLRALRVHDALHDTAYELATHHVVLALGHSARDTFAMLRRRGVYLEAKPFSVGFRIEHPQSLIDRARWGRHAGHPLLGAAEYRLVHHASNGRSVYSFCMCPGGTVVAATSEPGRVVTNGMSQYSRNERNANAGMVVGIEPADYVAQAAQFQEAFGDSADPSLHPGETFHPLSGIVLQRALESNAFVLGGGTYEAPGQLVGDFVADRPSTDFGEVMPSYKPGVRLGSLHTALPSYAIAALREALPAFGKKIPGFDRADAVLTGVETRTSAPLRITRGENLQSLKLRGLFPAGEGAGYAGGILSAGVDGIKVAEAVLADLAHTSAMA